MPFCHVDTPTIEEKVESTRAWIWNKTGNKLEDFKKMLEDIKELWGVLTATHRYNNTMTEGKQLHNNHDKIRKNGQF